MKKNFLNTLHLMYIWPRLELVYKVLYEKKVILLQVRNIVSPQVLKTLIHALWMKKNMPLEAPRKVRPKEMLHFYDLNLKRINDPLMKEKLKRHAKLLRSDQHEQT